MRFFKHSKAFIRRFTFILTLSCVVNSVATALDTPSQKKETGIELSLTNASVVSVIEAISKGTGYKFIYNEVHLSQMNRITFQLKNATLEETLKQLSAQTGLSFRKMNDTYFVSYATEPAKSDNTEAKAQSAIRITGSVSNEKKELLHGASVTVKGAVTGTVTDLNGEFTLTVPGSTAILQFQCPGYQEQEVTVGNRSVVSVTLLEASTGLEDVVVVAFGTQKKQSVVGAVTTVNPALLKMPTSNLTTALAGNIAGMIAYQRSGEPGQDNADFFVRGITTFGTNTNPLILIDGIELTSTDLARLRPDDIASFSIMKDATATALYGARGANGVILVTTKQGTVGPAKLSLRLENSFSMPTRTIEVADPVSYMKLYNEAVLTRNPGGSRPYSQEKIEMTETGRFPLIYPANDWKELLFKDYTMNQRANLSISGGGGVARYYISGSYNRDNGMMKVDRINNFNNNIAINNYNLRSNVNIDVTKTTEVIVRLSGNFEDYSGPIPGGTTMYDYIVHTNPVLFPAYFPIDRDHEFVNHTMFGNDRDNPRTNPYAEMVRGYKEQSRSQILAQLEMKQDLKFITKGLSIRGMLNISRLSQFAVNRSFSPFFYQIRSDYDRRTGAYKLNKIQEGTEYLGYTERDGDRVQNSTSYFEGMTNYAREFGKHNLSGLLVFQMRQSLDANTGKLELSLPSRSVGLSGRATYSFDNRYFAEFNFGYNGSERFDISHRFGFFPSAGVAWSISSEKFWEPLRKTVSNLKLRYSYGMIGNDQIGSKKDRFFYLSEVKMDASGALFGTNLLQSYNGVWVNRYANPNIGWETSYKQNYALEVGLWRKVNLIAEYFTEYRNNILMNREVISRVMGLTAPVRANIGEASGKGVDLSLEYQQSWNPDFWTSARANFTYATSKYEIYEEPDYPEAWRSRIGYSLKQEYGYIAERLFVDDDEAANSPRQYLSTQPYGGGDIKYLDVNRDGKIDDADMVPIGNPTVPEIVYGFGVSLGYKGFDFSAFFQGVANESFWINAASTSPFHNDAQMLKVYADSHWSEEYQNIYATWPRLSPTIHTNNAPGAHQDSNGNWQWTKNTWFMRDGAFLRLKQVELGYTLPKRISEKIKMSSLRFYVSGSNLFLLSKFKLWDVEMAGEGLGYPIQKVFNVGLNLSF